MEPFAITLPGRDDIMARLTSANSSSSLIERFYPLLAKHGGRELEAMGIVNVFTLAIIDYTRDMPAVIGEVLIKSIPSLVYALVDDDTMRAEVMREMQSSGIIK